MTARRTKASSFKIDVAGVTRIGTIVDGPDGKPRIADAPTRQLDTRSFAQRMAGKRRGPAPARQWEEGDTRRCYECALVSVALAWNEDHCPCCGARAIG